jgi:hypothetical protein
MPDGLARLKRVRFRKNFYTGSFLEYLLKKAKIEEKFQGWGSDSQVPDFLRARRRYFKHVLHKWCFKKNSLQEKYTVK